MRIFITSLFIIILGVLPISISAQQNIIPQEEKNQEWEVVKTDKNDEPTWVIYTRKIAGTNFLEYKIEGDVASSPKACVALFREDIHNQADDSTNKKYPTYEIVDESKEGFLTYVIHKEPFPLKDTEMSVNYVFFNDEDGSKGVRWHEAWDDCPIQPSKKLSRVQTFRGSWYFLPISNKNSKAINSVQFDPQKMPLWLVEPMVFKFLKEGLENMRKMPPK
ncbi:MAG: hypothetical protein AB8H47_12240 [Bacteroidia bacterium]